MLESINEPFFTEMDDTTERKLLDEPARRPKFRRTFPSASLPASADEYPIFFVPFFF